MSSPINLITSDSFAFGDSLSITVPITDLSGTTRGSLAARLQNQFQNSVYYQSIDFNDSIQDGLDEVCAFTGAIYNSATIPFIGGKTYYDMLSLLPDYIGIVAIFNSSINRWLFPTSLRKLNQVRIDWETAYGTPYYFVPVNHRYVAIYMKPGPTVTNYGKMYVFYRAAGPQLTDGMMIPLPNDHIQALESYSILDLWEQAQEFGKAENYFQSYTKNLDELRVLMRNRRNPGRITSLR